MTIPIRNLFFLLCYAWDVLEEAEVVDVDALEHDSPLELLARVLVSGTRHVLRRGLDRHYLESREDTTCLRGRIDLQESVKRVLLPRAMAHVVHEELSPDFLPNRVIKSTISELLGCGELSRDTRGELAEVWYALRDVGEIRLTTGEIARVRLHGNNRSYRLLMEVCGLIVDNLLPEEGGEGRRFRDFTRDDPKMRSLFQKFVTNLLAREQREFSVAAESLPWQDAVGVAGGSAALPRMFTDIVLTSQDHRIVIDTKFTSRPFERYRGAPSFRTEHLYQLWTYVTHIHVRSERQGQTDGMLLYPTTTDDFDERWIIQGHRIRVLSVNLADSPAAIKARLLSLCRE